MIAWCPCARRGRRDQSPVRRPRVGSRVVGQPPASYGRHGRTLRCRKPSVFDRVFSSRHAFRGCHPRKVARSRMPLPSSGSSPHGGSSDGPDFARAFKWTDAAEGGRSTRNSSVIAARVWRFTSSNSRSKAESVNEVGLVELANAEMPCRYQPHAGSPAERSGCRVPGPPVDGAQLTINRMHPADRGLRRCRQQHARCRHRQDDKQCKFPVGGGTERT